MAKTLVVGAAIVDSLDTPTRLLAAQRSYPQELAGQWEFPGGKVESGESPENALLREIREELGCGIILGPPVAPAATHTQPSTPKSTEPDASSVPPQLASPPQPSATQLASPPQPSATQLASPPQPSATMQPTSMPHSATLADSSTALPPTGEHSRTTETAPTTPHNPARTTNTSPHELARTTNTSPHELAYTANTSPTASREPMPTSRAPFLASRRGSGRHEPLPASRTAPSPPGAWPLPGGRVMLLWLATIVPGESPHCGKDHQQLRWVTADDVAALSWLTGDRQIIPTMQRLLTR